MAGYLQVALVLSTLFCALVAGFLFAFAVVIMPGIAKLPNREFLRAFQVMDGVIQRGQPLFALVWLGAVLALAVSVVAEAATGAGAGRLAGVDRLLLFLAGGAFIFGVQLPTFRVNIPLNNAVQALDLDTADEAVCAAERERFEGRWNRWNVIRTGLAVVTALLLAVLLLRL